MAEYLPLLERAVAGLSDATPEARRAIYERARGALLGQLRTMDPPVPEEDIARESAALDDAIVRLEARVRTPEPVEDTPPAVVATPRAEPPPASSAPVARSGNLGSPRPPSLAPLGSKPPGLPLAKAPPVVSPPIRERPVLAPRPRAAALQKTAAPFEPSAGQDAAESAVAAGPRLQQRPPMPARPLNTAPRVGIDPRNIGVPRPPSPFVPNPPFVPPALETVSPPDVKTPLGGAEPIRIEPRIVTPGLVSALSAEADTARDSRARRGVGFYAAIVLGALVVASVAVEAWKLRDRPAQFTAAQQTGTSEQTSKVGERISGQGGTEAAAQDESGDGGTVVPPPVAVGSQTTAAEPSASQSQPVANPAPAASVTSSTAAAPAPVSTSEPVPTTATNPAQDATVAVTQRAALLIDAPEEPQKVKTYPGSVVWKRESVSPGQGQPLSDAIVADVDIPDAKMTMTMVMKKNTEPQFPASHTIEFRFTDLPGNVVGAVKQINVPEMRIDDTSPTGDPMAGLPVAITDNNFLVGLSRGTAEGVNMQMLQTRNWIDVSLLMSSGKAAKITFEKGAPGQRIIDDAIKAWQ